MDTNVRSTFPFTRHTVPVMPEQRQGTILILFACQQSPGPPIIEIQNADDGRITRLHYGKYRSFTQRTMEQEMKENSFSKEQIRAPGLPRPGR
jgi:hypothetical protein